LENKKLGLTTILEWKMSQDEAEAFHLALFYEKEYMRIFNGSLDGLSLKRNILPKGGDPRKSNLFRYCWKLKRETKGLIEKKEYKNYIMANLFIVKINNGYVEPSCITGDKAWIRYKIWKRKYDQKLLEADCDKDKISNPIYDKKVIFQIDKTKKFLFEKCEGDPSYIKIKNFIDNGIFSLWCASQKISCYYLVLSPYIKESKKKNDFLKFYNISEEIIEKSLNNDLINYFYQEYKYEYDSFL